jgi:hypothetical protein
MICIVCKVDKSHIAHFSLNGSQGICNECKTDFKECTKCKNKKHIDQFHRDQYKKDGRRPSCKSCDRSAVQIRRFGAVKTKHFVNARRNAEEKAYIKLNSTDLDLYDI